MTNETKKTPHLTGTYKDSTKFVEQNMNFATQAFAPMLAANVSLLQWNADCCRTMARAYSQWFDFVGHRLEADAAFAQKLQTMKDPEGLPQACSKFIETAARDYQDEFSELAKVPTDFADAASDAMQDASRAVETKPTPPGE